MMSGVGHAEGIMEVCRQSQCDIVGLQETRLDEQDGFTAAAAVFTVHCSGAGEGGTKAKG